MEDIGNNMGAGGAVVQDPTVNGKKVVKKCNKAAIIVIVLAVLAVAGAGFGAYSILSSNSRITDLEQKLAERDSIIAELRGEDMPSDDVDASDNALSSDSVQPLAKSLLITSTEQAIDTGVGGAFALNISTTISDVMYMALSKQVGGLTDFEKEYEPDTTEQPAKISGSINFSVVGDMYGLEKNDIEGFEVSNIDVDHVVDVFVGGFGQALGDEVALFLMDDGTVEYMPIRKAAVNQEYKSYGKIPGVEDVIKFMDGELTYGPHVSHDILAQRADGKIYSLRRLLSTRTDCFER